MASYSLQDCLSSDNLSKKNFNATLSTINSRLLYPGKNGLVLVEGISDVVVMKHLFAYQFHMLGALGKNNVLKIMDNFNKVDYPNLICILDRDYEKVTTSDDRFFYYDCFDLEMSLVKHDDIFLCFTKKLNFSFKKIVHLRDKILETLMPLECLRYVNHELLSTPHIPQFSCDNLIGDFYPCYLQGKRQLKNHILASIYKLIDKSYTISDITYIKSMYITKYKELLIKDRYSYTNGHDFISMFIKETGKVLSEDQSAEESVSINCYLRDGFTIDIFSLTNLYKMISLYEDVHGIEIIVHK